MDTSRHSPIRAAPLMLALLWWLLGCRSQPSEPPTSASTPAEAIAVSGSARIEAPIFDSASSSQDVLRRFRTDLDSVDRLTGGAATREELISRFMVALEARDTQALVRLAMSKREFAWVYYPTATLGRAPYDVRADLLWYMVERRGYHGLREVLAQRGGQRFSYHGHRCAESPTVEGDNRIWGPCVVSYSDPAGKREQERLFGLIIERQGLFKFVSYSNPLD